MLHSWKEYWIYQHFIHSIDALFSSFFSKEKNAQIYLFFLCIFCNIQSHMCCTLFHHFVLFLFSLSLFSIPFECWFNAKRGITSRINRTTMRCKLLLCMSVDCCTVVIWLYQLTHEKIPMWHSQIGKTNVVELLWTFWICLCVVACIVYTVHRLCV